MKPQYLLIIPLLCAACLLVWQGSNNSTLEKRISAMKDDLQEKRDTSRSGRYQSNDQSVSADTSRFSRDTESAVNDAKQGLEEFMSLVVKGDESVIMYHFQKFVDPIENLNSEQLQRLYELLFEEEDSRYTKEAADLTKILLLGLIAEQNAEFGFEALDKLEPRQQIQLFATVAQKDPDRALAWLEESQIAPAQRLGLVSSVINQLMRDDPFKAIALLKEKAKESGATEAGTFALIPGSSLPVVEDAYRAEDDSEFKDQLAQMVLLSTYFQNGLEETKSAFDRLDLPVDQLIDFVGYGHDGTMNKDFGNLLSWAIDRAPAGNEELEQTLYTSAQQWAGQDFNAAAEWLQTIKEPSYRDSAVSGFVIAIVNYDPEAAMHWAMEIQDPARAAPLYEKALDMWKKNDPTAAAAWLAEREVE